MPSYGFPPGTGGGGGGGTSVVIGGSGAAYPTVAAAQAGETEQSATDTTAASSAGSFTGTVLPPWLAVGDLVVLTDATPGTGLVCQWATIKAIAGLVITIDKPWNFGVGETVTYVRPIILVLTRALTESVSFTKNVLLNLGGNRLNGSIDFTGGAYHEIVGGGGSVTNGITTTNRSVTILRDIGYIGLRAGTIYAYLMTSGDNLGATECYNCGFGGNVAGRRGFGRWIVIDCTNDGIAETDQNCPYRLVESVAGVAIVVSNADVFVRSQFAGAIFYSENSLTGPAASISIKAEITVPKMLFGIADPVQQATNFFVWWAKDAATLTMTPIAGSHTLVFVGVGSLLTVVGATGTIMSGAVVVVNFSGTLNVASTGTLNMFATGRQNLSEVLIQGSGTMSGSVTIGSGFPSYGADGATDLISIRIQSAVTGSVTVSTSPSVQDCFSYRRFLVAASQTAGAPSFSITGAASVTNCLQYITVTMTAGVTISVGTWLISGSTSVTASLPSDFINLPSVVSGGTWTISGAISWSCLARGSTISLRLGVHAGTGGTLTISSATVRIAGQYAGSLQLAVASGAGATVNVTSSEVVVRGCRFVSASTLISATTATSTASATGVLTFENCTFVSALTVLNSAVVGSVASGPSDIAFNYCLFEDDVTTEAGLGTITWSGATFLFAYCYLYGQFTFVGTRFSSVQSIETTFDDNTGSQGRSITASGTRPAIHRHWKSRFLGTVLDLFPDILHDYEVRPSSGALAAGNLLTINASGQATGQTAGGRNQGVLLIATAGADEAAVMVRRGVVFVDTNAVVAGDNLIVDAAGTPTRAITGASVLGQTIGFALEATGATQAGESYSIVDLA